MKSSSTTERVIVLSTRHDVDNLRSSLELFGRLNRAIEVRFQDAPKAEREQLEFKLNELGQACGCAQGSLAGVITVILVVGVWAQKGYSVTARSMGVAFLIIIVASFVGKFVGLMTARIRLHLLLTKLLDTAPEILTFTEEQADESNVHGVLRLG